MSKDEQEKCNLLPLCATVSRIPFNRITRVMLNFFINRWENNPLASMLGHTMIHLSGRKPRLPQEEANHE
jgi:hypothetical protein